MLNSLTNNRAVMLLTVLLLSLLCCFAQAEDSSLTPQPGEPLRKRILDGLREEVKRLHGLEVVFVVRHLKVKDGWAWAHTSPQSPDGKNRYEDISALLRLHNGKWLVEEIPCTEPENQECLDGPEYFVRLKKLYPTIAVEIFPDRTRNLED